MLLGVGLWTGSAHAQDRTEARELAGAGPFEIGLHGRVTRARARNEQVAWLTLALPLESFSQPRAAQAPVSPVTPPPAPATALVC